MGAILRGAYTMNLYSKSLCAALVTHTQINYSIFWCIQFSTIYNVFRLILLWMNILYGASSKEYLPYHLSKCTYTHISFNIKQFPFCPWFYNPPWPLNWCALTKGANPLPRFKRWPFIHTKKFFLFPVHKKSY